MLTGTGCGSGVLSGVLSKRGQKTAPLPPLCITAWVDAPRELCVKLSNSMFRLEDKSKRLVLIQLAPWYLKPPLNDGCLPLSVSRDRLPPPQLCSIISPAFASGIFFSLPF